MIQELLFSLNKFIVFFNQPQGTKFLIDVFATSIHPPQFLFIKFFTRQEFLDFVIINSFFLLTILTLSYIFFSLLHNMFDYSFRYFIVNWFFSQQPLVLDFESDVYGEKITFVKNFLLNKNYSRKNILIFKTADAMLTSLLLLYTLVFFIILLNFNYFSISVLSADLITGFNFNLLPWISFHYDFISFGFIVDHLSLLMLVVVLTISTLVHYYSIDYMATDPRLLTFMKYLSGFTLAMVILVTANNFALVFLGWEGVGMFSYLLIGFWYTWTLALKASLKAVIVNWVGDAALIIASALVLHFFGTLEFKKLQFLIIYLFDNKISNLIINFFLYDFSVITLICIFLLIAAVGKSAQFGLHTWLPDAMEGPTPVSALIHAATMVTAGVYLIVWTSFLFEFSDFAWNLTLMIGAFTALFGSLTACYQFDIKWIIAFSTCSQLGYMFLACGLSAYNLAMFHLFIHAFFKALLFLCAGSVIHTIGDEQDIWKMGGLLNYLPITYAGLSIGFFSLAGLPFTSGFFSKDTIIELAMTKRTIPALYAYICASLGAWFTAFYSFWFFYYVIFNESFISRSVFSTMHEHGKNMLNVICILTLTTIFIGGLTKNPLTTPFSFIFFNDSIFIWNYNFYFNIYENFIEFYEVVHKYVFNYLKIILFIIPFFAIYISLLTYWYWDLWSTYDVVDIRETCKSARDFNSYTDFDIAQNFYSRLAFQKFFEMKGFTDQTYNKFIVKPLLLFSYQISYKELDRGWLEYFFIKLPTFFCLILAKIFSQNFDSLKINFLPALAFIGIFISYCLFILFK